MNNSTATDIVSFINERHIFLVEDDPAIAMSLKITFKRENWQMTWVDCASDAIPLLLSLQEKQIHLSAIILDVGLPDGDGLSLCRQIRNHPSFSQATWQKNIPYQYSHLPIIFLTARNEEIDRVLGLEMGADDYCSKPFSPRELVARLKAIWRRQKLEEHHQSQPHQTSHLPAPATVLPQPADTHATANSLLIKEKDMECFQLSSGTWQYHTLSFTLYWQNQKLNISNTERKLLLQLLNHPQQVFTREQLLTAISEYPDHRLARTIDSHIKSIRKQLAQIEPNVEVIYTHRGLGYSLCPA